jgi:hypothetical protein
MMFEIFGSPCTSDPACVVAHPLGKLEHFRREQRDLEGAACAVCRRRGAKRPQMPRRIVPRAARGKMIEIVEPR